MLDRLLYIGACLVVPFAWGLLSYAITRAIEKRRPPPPPVADKPQIPDLEYYL
jgi:hypothetical protein